MRSFAQPFHTICHSAIHQNSLALLGALLLSALLIAGCDGQAPAESSEAPPQNGDHQAVTDDVTGVSLSAPAAWTKYPDEFTEKGIYGFVMAESPGAAAEGTDAAAESNAEGNDEEASEARIHVQPQLRVALVGGATPDEIDDLAQAKLDEYPEGYGPNSDLELKKNDIEINGYEGVVVSGLPAALEEQYTVAFIGVEDRVYKVGVWRGLDAEAKRRFSMVKFQKPTRSVASLNVPTQTAYLKKMGLPAEGQEVAMSMERTGGERLAAPEVWNAEEVKAALEGGDAVETMAIGNCADQPYNLPWQTQWINDTRRYGQGISRVLSYRNRGRSPYHKGCWGIYKQFYALDFGLSNGSKIYSAIPGRVTHAGRSNAGGLWSCGIFVDVTTRRNGVRYANRSCHLRSLNVRKGSRISLANLPYVVIGRIGLTGVTSTPHLHTAMFKYARISRAGHVYGGTSVRPRSVRYYSNGGGRYNSFRVGYNYSY